jgi:hypothetical protein
MKKAGTKKEVSAYTGPHDPNLKLEDFSKDVLAKLVGEYARLAMLIEAFWVDIIGKRYGREEAFRDALAVRARQGPMEMRSVKETLKIPGDDVLTFIKTLDFIPDGPGFRDAFENHYDIKDNNHVILTVTHCRPVEYYEEKGDREGQRWLCEILEPTLFDKYAQDINPDMKCVPLKIPPRESKDGIFCQWEIKLEPKPKE